MRLGVGGRRGGNGGAAESSESEEMVFDEEELLDLVVTEPSDYFDDNSSELSDSEDEECFLRMQLDIILFLTLLSLFNRLPGFRAFRFGEAVKTHRIFQVVPRKTNPKRTWFRSDQRKMKKGY